MLLIGYTFSCLSSCAACLQPVITRYAQLRGGSEYRAAGAHGWFSGNWAATNFKLFLLTLLSIQFTFCFDWVKNIPNWCQNPLPSLSSPLPWTPSLGRHWERGCTQLNCPGTKHLHPRVIPRPCCHKLIPGFLKDSVSFVHSMVYFHRSTSQFKHF